MFCCGNMEEAHQPTSTTDTTSISSSQPLNKNNDTQQQQQQQVEVGEESAVLQLKKQQQQPEAVAWSISFGGGNEKKRPKRTAAEKKALALNRGVGEDKDGSLATPPSGSDADVAVVVGENDNRNNNNNKKKQPLEVVNINEQPLDESVAIPRNLITTREHLLARHHFDQNRWLCLSRPQYKRSCGVSSLTSVWNTLYSRIGYGDLPPISQEEVIFLLGFTQPQKYPEIRWGPFTGNTSLMKWFYKINKAKGVKGKAFFFWKPHGNGRTIGITDEKAEEMTMEALRNPKCALIYHCKNHYFVPIGFRSDARAPHLAMLPNLERSEYDLRLLIGEPSRGGMSSIHEKLFSDVAKDLHTEAPFTFNIRHTERGVQKREKCKKVGGTLHCFIGFRSDLEGDVDGEFDDDEGEVDEENENEDTKDEDDE